jgi:hypothetical protein
MDCDKHLSDRIVVSRVSRVGRLRHFAADWILPPAVRHLLLQTRRRSHPRIASADERAVLAKNARLQSAFAGRRCFVLANGPSLADVDIGSLSEEITIVMNHFNQHPALRVWQPVVHCAAEPASFYDGPEKLKFLQALLDGYSSTIHVFPVELKPTFDRIDIVPPERLAFVKQDGNAVEFDRLDLTEPIPGTNDTSILAVCIAIAMGCDPIVLLGLDYNWLSHRTINRHFYDDSAMSWPAEDMAGTPYLDAMRQSLPSWEAHAELRRIADRSGQRIINATEGSFLDVYPTARLDQILAKG